MTPSDPIRLLDDPQMAASLRADLAHASAASVHGLDHAAGVAGLQAAIATEAAAASGAAGGASTLGKVAIAILLLGGSGVGVWAATRSNDIATPPPEVTTASVDGGAVEPAEPARPQRPAPAVVEEPEAEPEPAIEVAPEEDEPAKLSRPRATKARKAVPEEAEDATDSVLREARMIADAREALGRDPRAALALAQGAAREFPRGQLVEEREAIAIRALAKLGRSEAAHARAERFLARFGAGPHAEAVRRAIQEPSE